MLHNSISPSSKILLLLLLLFVIIFIVIMMMMMMFDISIYIVIIYLRGNKVIEDPGNVLVMPLHIRPGSINGHGLHLLLRQQLPADGFPLL